MAMHPLRSILVAALSLPSLVACEGDRSAPTPVDSGASESPQSRAQRAVRTFKTALRDALTAALAEGGPEHALAVCRAEAPRLAASSAEPGLRIGRATSRPRNPTNLAAGWHLDALAALETADAGAVYTAELPAGTFVYAEPLRIDSLCLTCHGAPASTVAAALERLYPDDRATGYALGDFRGIVWAELTR